LMADVDIGDSSTGVLFPGGERDIQRVVSSSKELRCVWDGGEITTSVSIWPPDQGYCEGAGGARFGPLLVNGLEYPVLTHELHSFPDCVGIGLAKITAQRTPAGIVMETCTGSWDWTEGWHDIVCTEEAASGHGLSPQQVGVLLDEICAELSHCPKTADRTRLQQDPPRYATTFADAVLTTVGLSSGRETYPEIWRGGDRDRLAQAFRDAIAASPR
jgi:hypothetical protein